ncbi:MAG: aspartyl/glutamyl-tRNA amidotransferase subunit C [Oscillospiraceae bacterium]|nr:aspartyl/glutamyl-tRNA amidotransferase subunit C [Oscillospiraceae bacterium]
MSRIDKQMFDKLSELSKIDFTGAEETALTGELDDIIEFIGKVKEFSGEYDDMRDGNSVGFSDLRDDVRITTATPEQLLSNTVCENDCYVIPKVVD